jgi:putative inorganic carbon (hco3(-)) transporter
VSKLQKLIFYREVLFYFFATLLFFVPFVLWPFTSEVFEFNKIVLVYLLTTLIGACWLVMCIIEKKFIFRRTLLDIPLVIFLGTQFISTILSIDFYTSIFGYYSRFNGGLLSSICYALCYWALVSNLNKGHALKLIKSWLLTGGIIAIIAIGEHFSFFAVCAPIQYSQVQNAGANQAAGGKYENFTFTQKLTYLWRTNCWVQDVESRVFATLGQPNWLAAWITALSPLAWAGVVLNQFSKRRFKNSLIYLSLSTLFFITLLFTKSRSGLVGFAVADLVFWALILIKKFKENLVAFIVLNLSFIILALLIGTQWTPSIGDIFNTAYKNTKAAVMPTGTVLETGGTESGTIRKIVWKGAMEVWQHYPVFGTGVETFAYSYYLYRPIEHNTTSEWDYIYNKAHNEFLNFAANSGSVGLLAYLVVIIFSVIQICNLKFKIFNSYFKFQTSNLQSITDEDSHSLQIALLAGYVSLSVSNFFGFSVVPTQIQFFLFPALAVAISNKSLDISEKGKKTNSIQKLSIFFILIATGYLLIAAGRYWYADILYSRAKAATGTGRPDISVPLLTQAITLIPNQALYYAEQSTALSAVAMAYTQDQDASTAAEFTKLAETQIEKSVSLSPSNISIRRLMFGIYVRLSTINEDYLKIARDRLFGTISLAPTDPKLYYNLGIADANLGNMEEASNNFAKAIELKPNYADARVQYAALLVHLKNVEKARYQLNYILTNIDPKNETARQALDNLK